MVHINFFNTASVLKNEIKDNSLISKQVLARHNKYSIAYSSVKLKKYKVRIAYDAFLLIVFLFAIKTEMLSNC